LELAWEGYPWGTRVGLPDGEEYTMNQEVFCARDAATNDLKLLQWVREEKECDWNCMTSNMAAGHGNLELLKYCVENGCEVEALGHMPPKTATSTISFITLEELFMEFVGL